MSADSFVFDTDQLHAAGRQFVEQGPTATKAQRQAEVDGALNFLLSDATRKLRVQPSPRAGGLSPEGAYQPRPERIG